MRPMAISKGSFHTLLVYDLPEFVEDHEKPQYLLDHKDRPTERDVAKAIQKLGMRLSVCGVFDDHTFLHKRIKEAQPNVIFNLCETYNNSRSHEANIAAMLELTGIPMTGSRSDALHLCKDKAITKKILRYDQVQVPRFIECHSEQDIDITGMSYPIIVKPLNLEASEGIAQASVVNTYDDCLERVRFILEKFKTPVILEEFIHGREIYVGVLESPHSASRVSTLPARELFIKNLKVDQLKIATYRAKWDDSYRKKWGISTGRSLSLPEETAAMVYEDSKRIFKSLGMRGYGRIDWRVSKSGQPYFLEANPNPALAQSDDFALAAKDAGQSYTSLILQIIESALAGSATGQLQKVS